MKWPMPPNAFPWLRSRPENRASAEQDADAAFAETDGASLDLEPFTRITRERRPRAARQPRVHKLPWENRSPLVAILQWLYDFPRPTWELWHAGHEGRSLHFRRKWAVALRDEENDVLHKDAQYDAQWMAAHRGGSGVPARIDEGELAYVRRAEWMRPSEVDSLPEM